LNSNRALVNRVFTATLNSFRLVHLVLLQLIEGFGAPQVVELGAGQRLLEALSMEILNCARVALSAEMVRDIAQVRCTEQAYQARGQYVAELQRPILPSCIWR
jgi:hypothetical protein